MPLCSGCLWSLLSLVPKLRPSVPEKVSEELGLDSLTKPGITDPSCPWLHNTVGRICVPLPHWFASIYFTLDSWLHSLCNCRLPAGRRRGPAAPTLCALLSRRFRVLWPEVAKLDHFIKDVAWEYYRTIVSLSSFFFFFACIASKHGQNLSEGGKQASIVENC